MSLKVLLGGRHRTRLLKAHNRVWREDQDYSFFIGLSGEGFRFMYDAAESFRYQLQEGGWPLHDCFAGEGIPVSIFAARPAGGMEGIWTGEAHLRELVMTTLSLGFPVLILGRTGSDWVLLATGYEDGGDTLVGWTFVPGADMSNKSFAPEDCQYIRDWPKGADAVALVKGMPEAPTNRERIVRRALRRGEEDLRQAISRRQDVLCRFYDVWLDKLANRSFWNRPFTGRPGIDPDIWDLAERRCFCADFLTEASELLSRRELMAGAAAFREIHDLMWSINGLCCGDRAQDKLRDEAVRREIAGIVQACRALDEQAADAIALALVQ